MQAPFDNIVQHLFHQPSLLSVTVDELERMAQQHPYFAAAHFLLLKKMQDTAHPSFDSQLHKTTLYFNNPLWLQFLLQPEAATGFTVLEKAPFITDEKAAEPIPDTINHAAASEHYFVEDLQPAGNLSAAGYEAFKEHRENDNTTAPADATHANGIMDVITDVFAEPAEDNNNDKLTDTATEAQEAQDQTAIATPLPLEPATHTEAQESIENIAAVNPDQTVEPDDEQNAVTSVALANDTAPLHEIVEPAEEILQGVPETAATETSPVDETIVAGQNLPEQVADTIDQEPLPADAEPLVALTGDEKPLLRTIIETPAAKDDLLFEPYHTVDYFASQGIKLSKMEANSRDKLGTQLRSFTEWLKTMKKLPQVSIDKMLSENDESKVVEDAIHSIENKEVITEAMAEVFEKQGLTDKAVEVYRKLSLLNPPKSAYFAAKIDLLKH